MSMPERLDANTFQRLLGIYGGRAERWPEAWREPLARFLESSAEARAQWAEAGALDRLLDAVPEVEPAPALMARIAALPARHPRAARARFWPFHGALLPLLGWGMAAVLGIVLGVAQPSETDEGVDPGQEDVATLGADDPSDDTGDDPSDDEWSEVADLVWGADWAAEEE
jgi:hypothetical protein